MRGGSVPLSDLIISRRVRSELEDYKVLNLTAAALMREKMVSSTTPPGRKVRFAVVGRERALPHDRVRMRFEILSRRESARGRAWRSGILPRYGLSSYILHPVSVWRVDG